MKKIILPMKYAMLSLTMAFFASCSTSSDGDDDVDVREKSHLYVLGGVYGGAGELRSVIDGKISEDYLEVWQDSKIKFVNSYLMVLERYGADNIMLVDPENNKVVWQKSLDDASNPSDVVLASENEAWVSLEGAAKIIKVALSDGSIKKTVKTDKFLNEGAGSPNLIDLEVRHDTLFALFQRLDGYYMPSLPGLLALYTLKDGGLLDTIRLANVNPSAMGFADGELYVSSMGAYNASYGTDADDERGIERVDLAKKKTKLVIGGKKLGGGVYVMALDSKNNIAYAAIYREMGDVFMTKIDLAESSATKIKGVVSAEGSVVFDENEGKLYIGERSGDGALLVYDGDKVKTVPSDAEDPLPPYSIAVGQW